MTPTATVAAWDQVRTVGELLALRSVATPDATAFRHEIAPGTWEDIPWNEFTARVARVQQSLLAAGLRKGDRLALFLPASLRWELLHHAALGIGVAVVGLDSHDLPSRLADMCRQAAVAAAVVPDINFWRRVDAAAAVGPGVPLVIVAGTLEAPAPSGGSTQWMSWADLERPANRAAATGSSLPVVDPQDVATLIFTSGSTGAPKGIAYTHAQLCMAVDAIARAFSFASSGSRLLCWLPLSNLFQRVVNLAGLRQGAVTTLLADPRRVMDVVADVSPHIFVGVPRFYEKLYDGIRANIARQPRLQRRLALWAWSVGRRVGSLNRDGRPLPASLALAHRVADAMVLRRIRAVMGTRLKCMVSGSAPLAKHLLDEFQALGWIMLEAYGLSENVMPMALNLLDDHRFGSVGRPLPGNDVRFDAAGQILVRGPGLFTGYWGEPPGARLDADGYYATGDLGHIDADGFLWLTGRNADMIKTSTGRRVAPVGVEKQLGQVDGIDQAMLVGAGRKGLVALCTLTSPLTDAAARSQLESALRSRILSLNDHERPMGVALLPRPFSIEQGEITSNLKLRRAAIEDRHAAPIAELYRRLDEADATGRRDIVII